MANQSDWEASSDESESDEPAPAPAPPKKKGTLKAKLAEKEAMKAKARNEANAEEYDSDDVLDPRLRALKDKEKELAADLNAAKDLLGTTSLGGRSPPSDSCNCELRPLICYSRP